MVFFVSLPRCDPAVYVFELRAEEFKGGGASHDAQDGEEDVIARVIGRGKDVEYCSQDGKSETGPVVWGGFYGSGEVLANFGEEFVKIWGLANQVDEEVIGGYEFCILNLNLRSG